MFKESADRIDYWTKEIERLEKELEEAKINNLSDNLNYAWQDDELEEMGLR